MLAAPYLWACEHDPDSVDAAVGYVLRAQEMHDLRMLRRRVEDFTSKEQ